MSHVSLKEFHNRRSVTVAILTDECELCQERTVTHLVQVCDGTTGAVLTTGLVCLWCAPAVVGHCADEGPLVTLLPMTNDVTEWVKGQIRR